MNWCYHSVLRLLIYFTLNFTGLNGKFNSQFSDLIKTDVSVLIDDLTVFVTSENATRNIPKCTLTLHKNNCAQPAINHTTKIGWNTKVCYNWKCESDLKEYAMRVENCWTGSVHNPVYLIDDNGCTVEKSMLQTPRYEYSLLRARSLGWLSVRLVGSTHIRLSCTVKLCHLCEDSCEKITPPKNCVDTVPGKLHDNVWNNTEHIDRLCYPELFTEPPMFTNRGAAVHPMWDSWPSIVGSVLMPLMCKFLYEALQ